MIKQCLVCSKDFNTYPSLIKIGKGKYCSKKCSQFTDNNKVIVSCAVCSNPLTTSQERIKEGRGKFCSRTCYEKDWNKRIPGWNKGKQATWMLGNQYRKGVPNINPSRIYGEKNHKWKGNDVGYAGLHTWVSRQLGKPKKCDHCGDTSDRRYEWANKSHEYLRDKNDWIRLCLPCHKKYDK